MADNSDMGNLSVYLIRGYNAEDVTVSGTWQRLPSWQHQTFTKTLGFIFSVEEADEMLIKCDGGVEAALDYAKMWCKYVKELLNWEEKRLSYGKIH